MIRKQKNQIKTKLKDLKRMLSDHKFWLISAGEEGVLANFNGWDLDNVNLEFAELSFARLNNASLKNANLWGANLSDAELKGADLQGAKISGAKLIQAQCEGANFTYASLEGAILENADLRKTNFTGAHLRRAKFIGVDLSSSKLIDADIEGADFRRAKFEATNFEGANIDEANFEETHRKFLNINNGLSQIKYKDDTMYNQLLDRTTSESEEKGRNRDKVASNGVPNILSSKEFLSVDLNAINPAIVEAAITDVIERLKTDIQLDQVKAISKHQNFAETIDKIDFKNGDIVTHKGQVAFKLDFNISHNLSLLLDRKGNIIDFFQSVRKIEK